MKDDDDHLHSATYDWLWRSARAADREVIVPDDHFDHHDGDDDNFDDDDNDNDDSYDDDDNNNDDNYDDDDHFTDCEAIMPVLFSFYAEMQKPGWIAQM